MSKEDEREYELNDTADKQSDQMPQGISDTLRSVARDLQNGSSHESMLGQVVDSLADASDALRKHDVTDAVRKASDFAKKNPAVFVGAAALAGFAATRLVKAVIADSDEQKHDSQHSTDEIT